MFLFHQVLKTTFRKVGFLFEDNLDAVMPFINADMKQHGEEMSSQMDSVLDEITFVEKREQNQRDSYSKVDAYYSENMLWNFQSPQVTDHQLKMFVGLRFDL